MKFIDLPDCLLDRIAFFVFEQGGLNDVISLSRTCSALHEHYTGFLLAVRPLNIRRRKKPNSITYESLNSMKLGILVFVRDLRLFDFKNRPPFPFESLQDLHQLTVQTSDFSFITQLSLLPRLMSLTIMYDHRVVRLPKLVESVQAIAENFSKSKFPALQIFRVSSMRSKVDRQFRNLISPNWKNPLHPEDFDKQFSSTKWSKFLLPFQNKQNALGGIFFMIIQKTCKTLRVVEVLGIDFSFLMGDSRKLKFSKHCTIILNAPSVVHSYSWIERVKAKSRVSVLIEDELTSSVGVTVIKKNQEPAKLTKLKQLITEVRNQIDRIFL